MTSPPGPRISRSTSTRPRIVDVRIAASTADLSAIQRLRHRLLGSFDGAIAGFEEDRDRLIEPADDTGTHLAAFDHGGRAVVAVRLDDVSMSSSGIRSGALGELTHLGIDLADGRGRSFSDRLHVSPGVDGHLVIRLLAAMMQEARSRGWIGDLCRCDPEHFEIRRTLGYRSLGVFASGVDERYPTQELMYLDFPRSRVG